MADLQAPVIYQKLAWSRAGKISRMMVAIPIISHAHHLNTHNNATIISSPGLPSFDRKVSERAMNR
jgi:hypothetical protein